MYSRRFPRRPFRRAVLLGSVVALCSIALPAALVQPALSRGQHQIIVIDGPASAITAGDDFVINVTVDGGPTPVTVSSSPSGVFYGTGTADTASPITVHTDPDAPTAAVMLQVATADDTRTLQVDVAAQNEEPSEDDNPVNGDPRGK